MGWEFTLLFVALAIGIAVGLFIGRKLCKNDKCEETQGILNVDCSDPADGPYLYLELTVPIAEVADHKKVLFDVHVIPDVSQK